MASENKKEKVTKKVEKPKRVVEEPKKKSIPLKEYVLLKDLPYDKGIKKQGTKVKLSKAGYYLLSKKGIV